jgi:hypothetical protein
MKNIRATAFEQIKPGNAAMYYPECNVLVGRTLDPQSKTPAFKGVVVRIDIKSNFQKCEWTSTQGATIAATG